MNTATLKITRIGNSRGVRLPAATLRRYRLGAAVIMEERSEGILLRPAEGATEGKLSWEETAQAMATSGEDWSEWEATEADGLAAIPWNRRQPMRVAERPSPYGVARKPKAKRS